MSQPHKPSRRRLRARTQAIRRALGAFDFIAVGTLHIRTKVCGRSNCRCATDHDARHGPYYEWSRRKNGRLVHRVISAAQADLIAQAIDNHRQIQALLTRWEDETAEEIFAPNTEKKR